MSQKRECPECRKQIVTKNIHPSLVWEIRVHEQRIILSEESENLRELTNEELYNLLLDNLDLLETNR